MQRPSHRDALRLSFVDPFSGSGAVGSGCGSAGSSRNAVKDRSVERRIDDVVVGHVCPLLNEPNVAQTAREVAFDRHLILNEQAA